MKSEFVPLSPTGFLMTFIAGVFSGAGFFGADNGWALIFCAIILLSTICTDAREEIRIGLYRRGWFPPFPVTAGDAFNAACRRTVRSPSCDPCAERYASNPSALTQCCRGYPATEGRVSIAELPIEPFGHDLAKHQERDR